MEEQTGQEEQETSAPPEGPRIRIVELIRERWTFEHRAPDDRSITLEYVVRNNSDETFFQLFLPLPEFLHQLRIIDEDGRRLNYLPNQEVERALKEIEHEEPETYTRFLDRFSHAQYRILIVLPRSRPLGPGEMRTIRLLHVDGRRPEYVERSVLTMPEYNIRHKRLLNHPHGLFVDVHAPADTHLSVDVYDDEVRNYGHYYVGEQETMHYHFGAYLPPAKKRPYTWGATYRVGPTVATQLILSLWLLLSVGLGTWLLLASGLPQVPSLNVVSMTSIAGGATAASAALLFTLRRSWADRYRLLLLPPLMVNAIAWLTWNLRS